MKIQDKATFYALNRNGCFGNRNLVWDSLEALRASGYTGLVSLRYAAGAGGGRFKHYIPVPKVEKVIQEWVEEGLNPTKIKLGETVIMKDVIVNGELARLHQGWYLHWSTQKINPRKALLSPKSYHAFGIRALVRLRRMLDPQSYADLMELFEEFPDSVVEFSCFKHNLGVLERKLLIWEVRDY